MITGIGSIGTTRTVDVRSDAVARSTAPQAGTTDTTEAVETPTSPAAKLASLGAPVDSDKVASIRARIAAGTYAVDPEAIAAHMIALDLPSA